MSGLELVGLTSNVLQILDFGTKLFFKTKELYESASGATAENERLQADVLEFKELVRLTLSASADKASSATASAIDKQLRNIAASCEQTAEDLIVLLNEQKVDPASRNRFMRSVKQSLLGEISKKKIKEMEQRLQTLHDTLFSCLTLDAKNQQSAIFSVVRDLKARSDELDSRITATLESVQNEACTRISDSSRSHLQEQAYAELTEQLDTFVKEARNVSKQQDILESLHFKSLKLRRTAIKHHHKATFQWIFDGDSTSFCRWLESEDSVYWIRGKAGSGKSTLMKFLASHEDTRGRLQSWAGKSRLFVANHFFWNAGNALQKSWVGLLRTLLYQILKECPGLIEIACASRWESSSRFEYAEPWTESELTSALEELARQKNLPLKFCFFIDGLDEYTDGAKRYRGEFKALIESVRRLASSPSIKVCVSSRPWPPFEKAFTSGEWQLRLEDLTKDDIKQYVEEELGRNPDFKRISEQDEKCTEIAPAIVRRAQGVFLWVFLVVEEIRKGLSKHDTYRNLEYRLNMLPDDLNDYFSHMLQSIEHVYWDETRRIFQVMVAAGQALPLLSFDFLRQEMDNPGYALGMKIQYHDLESLQLIYEREKARVNARCLDLLYVISCSDRPKEMIRFKVDFLHRTVRDFFLDTDALGRIARKRTDSTTRDFDPFISLCRIYLALSKALPFQDPDHPDFNRVFAFADSLMYYALQIENESDLGLDHGRHHQKGQEQENHRTRNGQDRRLQDVFSLLDDLDLTNEERIGRHLGFHWTNTKDTPKGPFQEYRKKTYLAAAIQARLSLYVKEKLRDDPRRHVRQKGGRPLLDYALRPTMVTPLQLSNREEGPVCDIVEFLLARGDAKPNKGIFIYDGKSPWELFLGACYRQDPEEHSDITTELADTMLLMIRHGANTEAKVQVGSNNDQIAGVLEVAQKLQLRAYQVRRLTGLITEKEAEKRQKLSVMSSLTSWVWGNQQVIS